MNEHLDIVPTRSVLRELEAELRMVHEGREFLDEKRTLLAGEILRRLERYDRDRRELETLRRRAVQSLAEASARHGLDGLLCQPATPCAAELRVSEAAFLGVPLVEARLEWPAAERELVGSAPSVESRRCRGLHRRLLEQSASVAAQIGTLRRLQREYRHTERRARALEDVLEPELSATVDRVREELDEQDQDEAVRARHGAHRSGVDVAARAAEPRRPS